MSISSPSRYESIFPTNSLLPSRLYQNFEVKISDAAGPIKKADEEQRSYQSEMDITLSSERQRLQDLNLSIERLELSTKGIAQ